MPGPGRNAATCSTRSAPASSRPRPRRAGPWRSPRSNIRRSSTRRRPGRGEGQRQRRAVRRRQVRRRQQGADGGAAGGRLPQRRSRHREIPNPFDIFRAQTGGIIGLLFILVIYVTMVYRPMAAAGRTLPDPHPLHLDVAALSYRQRLVRRPPAGDRLRHNWRRPATSTSTSGTRSSSPSLTFVIGMIFIRDQGPRHLRRRRPALIATSISVQSPASRAGFLCNAMRLNEGYESLARVVRGRRMEFTTSRAGANQAPDEKAARRR